MQIKRRVTGDIIHDNPNLQSANLQGADLQSANLQGADLQDADLQDADLRSANLQSANLRGANLQGADLRGANLRRADLRDANLRRANLRGADLRGAKGFKLLPIQDMRGYSFVHAVNHSGEWRICAGCRDFTIDQAREHWGDSYKGDRSIGDLYLYAVDWLEDQTS